MTVFKLPDLGEGLPDAEIVQWLVAEGDEVKLDQPLVSMETAKAVVEVPSPVSGRVLRFHGQAGDVIRTGAPLAEFEIEGAEEAAAVEDPESALVEDDLTEASAATAEQTQETDTVPAGTEAAAADESERDDSGTVVGNVPAGNEVLQERTSDFGGVRVTPAVRALARKLKVDIRRVQPSGADGVVTAKDVREAAESGSAPLGAAAPAAAGIEPGPASPPPTRAPEPPAPPPSGDWEPVRGTRRTMARVMSESHRSIVPTTLMDDADIHAWRVGEDITARLIRALWAGATAEPGLNAWFDGENGVRMVHKNMHVGMAVDTADGLFVAALRNVNQLERPQLRSEINRLRENAANRSIPPQDLKDYTIILSNFGKFAGRYATPVITPPCVSIVAAGTLRHEVVPVLGGMEVHRMIPLSLTFDHRACTGGEAARFLKAMLDDLARSE
ncbi:dihydrolipoamide acetyltransferase family protein [Wenzhouxiangella limi]|uniref:Dihydrolipoamide acetyltransferase component of pyruvate dehydrogenase complex n=1 Tax=Wenzhouxiangella limi TaxID=2707351 RepID=A0A845UW73_9GAMM|nr:dihydrolipoamide acetyltransferase family protein [Wenzhouxiangella limi]NDY94502.1 2-oxo acid dehydrogenase subunit E2 [Wenzhouxiangella limi]